MYVFDFHSHISCHYDTVVSLENSCIGVALTVVKYAFQKMPNTSLYCSSQYLTDEG